MIVFAIIGIVVITVLVLIGGITVRVIKTNQENPKDNMDETYKIL